MLNNNNNNKLKPIIMVRLKLNFIILVKSFVVQLILLDIFQYKHSNSNLYFSTIELFKKKNPTILEFSN